MVSQKDLRILDLLFDCLEKNQTVRTDTIADKMNVSTRTVRSNLDRIDYYLKSRNYPPLIRSRKDGVSLDILPGDISRARQELLTVSNNIYILSKAERILLIKLLLFETNGYLTYDYISQILGVSRKTIIEDVHQLKEDCQKSHVDVPGTKYGICYQGIEEDIRRLLLNGMLASFRPVELWEILRDIYPNRSVAIEKKWHSLISSKTVRICEEELLAADDGKNGVITDAQYYLTIILTALSIKRCEDGRSVGRSMQKNTIAASPAFPESLEENVQESTVIPLLDSFFLRLENRLSWTFPAGEKEFISRELGSLFHFEENSAIKNLTETLTGNLLYAVTKATGINYSGDPQLREGLSSHIFSLARNSFIPYQDPEDELKELIEEHTGLYQTIRQALQSFTGITFRIEPDTEAAFLMLHFLASDERLRSNGGKLYRTFVICNNGIGTSAIASARIQKLFPQIRVLGSASLRKAEELLSRQHPDFIITTVPFEVPGIPVIQISASLPEGDQRKLELFLNGRSTIPSESNTDPKSRWEELMSLIKKTCTIHDLPTLENGLGSILNISVPSRQLSLQEILTEDSIQLDMEAADWEEAIQLSARPLIKNGAVTEQYVDAMIRNVRELGPYIVITKGIAMPHAQSEDGALHTAMSLSVLRRGVSFGHSTNDPVRLIFCLAVAQKSDHMVIMAELVELISRHELVQQILKASSAKQVLLMIRGKEE